MVEFKKTDGWKVTFQPTQIPFIIRWANMGGSVHVAVRRKDKYLYLIPGKDVLDLMNYGLKSFTPIDGEGVRNWNWEAVRQTLVGL